MKVRAKRHIKHNGNDYYPGHILEVTAEQAAQLADVGAIYLEPITQTGAPNDEKAVPPEKKFIGK